jgi:hypothetical protein
MKRLPDTDERIPGVLAIKYFDAMKAGFGDFKER